MTPFSGPGLGPGASHPELCEVEEFTGDGPNTDLESTVSST